MSNVNKELDTDYFIEELDNLSNNIIKKTVMLGVTLPELADLIGMEYQTLWRITYKKNNYMPNFRVLMPIADFFNVSVADLLKNPNIPQYVPVINMQEVSEYILNKKNINYHEKILSNVYVHECAFALNIMLDSQISTKYIFKPCNKLIKNSYTILRYNNEKNIFLSINNVSDEFIKGINIYNNEQNQFNTKQINILAIAVKQIMDNDLI